MHIEPGVVEGGKMLLSYATATAALTITARLTWQTLRRDGAASLLSRALLSALLVFSFFEILPHHPVGISEVHLILGTTLLLLFGLAPAALGLACGLGVQSLFFAPLDLPQYGINITTLLAPLFAMSLLANRVIPKATAYVDLKYSQALKLSTAYQGGVVVWVAFWAFYGQGFGAANLANVASFSGAYLLVILVEPLIDLGVLAGAKLLHRLQGTIFVETRLYHPFFSTAANK
jgi:ABC-type Co2+ transport system permease subunit